MHSSRRLHVVIMAVTLAVGCGRDILTADTPPVVLALWNPSSGTLPTPTDLVRDAELGQLDLPIEDDQTAAEQELRGYLNTLDGYPLSTPLSIPVSGALDPVSVEPSLFVFDLDTGARLDLEVSFDADLGKISAHQWTPAAELGIVTPTAFEPGHRYAYALAGYDEGALGSHGEPVVADAAFTFVRDEKPVTDHPEALGDTPAEQRETAEALEEVRQDLMPLFDFFALRGLSRERIAVLGSFTMTEKPAVRFDPLAKQIPLPNNLLLNRDTGLVDLPASDADTEEQRHIKEGLSKYDGFSTTAALVLTATHKLDRDTTLSPTAVRVFRIDRTPYTEVTDLERGLFDDGLTFWVRPRLALEHSARYAYVVTDEVRATAGGPVVAQVFGALVRSSAPLLVGGKSQVGALDDESAALVEPLRQELDGLLDWLEASQGLERRHLAAAVPFDTLKAPRLLDELRLELYEREVPTTLSSVLVKTPWDRGLWIVMPNVKTIVTGRLTTLDHLDPYTTAFREDGSAVHRQIEFALTLPESAQPGVPIPVVLFGHGLETSRELVYMIADRLAEEGFAALSIDLPFHGERSVCKQDIECQSGVCASDGRCVQGDGSTSDLWRVSSPWPDGPTYPLTSGYYFVNAEDLLASRDHFLQAGTDLMQALRVLRNADWATATGGYELDGDDVVYLGMSLGGILGSVLAAVEPTIETFALNVPGADLVTLMQESAFFGPIIDAALAARDIAEGTPAHFQFMNAARWVLDTIDPLNFAPHAFQLPKTYVDPVTGETKTAPAKRVLLQMAEGDLIVPNVGTYALAERMGADLSIYTPLVSNHAFFFDPTSLEGGDARDEVMEFFRAR